MTSTDDLAACSRAGRADQLADDVALAVSELVTNAVEASARPLHVCLSAGLAGWRSQRPALASAVRSGSALTVMLRAAGACWWSKRCRRAGAGTPLPCLG
jgi:hypothetical protein